MSKTRLPEKVKLDAQIYLQKFFHILPTAKQSIIALKILSYLRIDPSVILFNKNIFQMHQMPAKINHFYQI